jgi:Icc-related predicted phosphoesterase
VNVLLGSDYHGDRHLQQSALEQLPQVDWYVNCGDFCSWAGRLPEAEQLGCHPHGQGELETLAAFLQSVDASGTPWLFVPGNHEPPAPTLRLLNQQGNFRHGQIVTSPQLVTLGSFTALVVPLTPPCGWCWKLGRDAIQQLIDTYASSSIQLVITHAPPLGVLDEGGQWYRNGVPTLKPLVTVLHPRYYFCGHMHLDGGKIVEQEGTTFANAALHNLLLELEE